MQWYDDWFNLKLHKTRDVQNHIETFNLVHSSSYSVGHISSYFSKFSLPLLFMEDIHHRRLSLDNAKKWIFLNNGIKVLD